MDMFSRYLVKVFCSDYYLFYYCVFKERERIFTSERLDHTSNCLLERFSVEFCTTKTKPIGHFTVVCSVTWPLNASEAGVDIALLRTSLLFHSNAK